MATKVPQKYLFPHFKLLYRYYVAQMLARLREELFGWKELAGIEGYHASFGIGYSHDIDTLKTRLRGAELKAIEGPRISEDVERFIFLRKCLWRQQMRLRRAERREVAQAKAKRELRKEEERQHPEKVGADGYDIDETVDHSERVTSHSDGMLGKVKVKVECPSSQTKGGVDDVNESPQPEHIAEEKERERGVQEGMAASGAKWEEGPVEDEEPPSYEIRTVHLSYDYAPESSVEKKLGKSMHFLPQVGMTVESCPATIFPGDGGLQDRFLDVVVHDVIEGGPADAAGIAVGDVLLELDFEEYAWHTVSGNMKTVIVLLHAKNLKKKRGRKRWSM